MSTLARSSLLAFGVAAMSACATMHPPAKATTVSGDGVELAVVAQSCQRAESPDRADTYLIEQTVQVEVRSSSPVEIRRDAFRLHTPSGYRLTPVSWGAAEPLSIEASRPQTFALRFMANGARACTAPVQLLPEQAVTRAGAPVRLAAITFTPVAAR